eukprot:m.63371 g.63371  ORF g.63371 m.63371 type:complete len:1603 (+) comp7455_c0_seq1:213-5021(+)
MLVQHPAAALALVSLLLVTAVVAQSAGPHAPPGYRASAEMIRNLLPTEDAWPVTGDAQLRMAAAGSNAALSFSAPPLPLCATRASSGVYDLFMNTPRGSDLAAHVRVRISAPSLPPYSVTISQRPSFSYARFAGREPGELSSGTFGNVVFLGTLNLCSFGNGTSPTRPALSIDIDAADAQNGSIASPSFTLVTRMPLANLDNCPPLYQEGDVLNSMDMDVVVPRRTRMIFSRPPRAYRIIRIFGTLVADSLALAELQAVTIIVEDGGNLVLGNGDCELRNDVLIRLVDGDLGGTEFLGMEKSIVVRPKGHLSVAAARSFGPSWSPLLPLMSAIPTNKLRLAQDLPWIPGMALVVGVPGNPEIPMETYFLQSTSGSQVILDRPISQSMANILATTGGETHTMQGVIGPLSSSIRITAFVPELTLGTPSNAASSEGAFLFVEGDVEIDGLEMSFFGSKTTPGIVVNSTAPAHIRRTCIHDSLGSAVSVTGVSNLEIVDSVIVNTPGIAVEAEAATNFEAKTNLILGLQRPAYVDNDSNDGGSDDDDSSDTGLLLLDAILASSDTHDLIHSAGKKHPMGFWIHTTRVVLLDNTVGCSVTHGVGVFLDTTKFRGGRGKEGGGPRGPGHRSPSLAGNSVFSLFNGWVTVHNGIEDKLKIENLRAYSIYEHGVFLHGSSVLLVEPILEGNVVGVLLHPTRRAQRGLGLPYGRKGPDFEETTCLQIFLGRLVGFGPDTILANPISTSRHFGIVMSGDGCLVAASLGIEHFNNSFARDVGAIAVAENLNAALSLQNVISHINFANVGRRFFIGEQDPSVPRVALTSLGTQDASSGIRSLVSPSVAISKLGDVCSPAPAELANEGILACDLDWSSLQFAREPIPLGNIVISQFRNASRTPMTSWTVTNADAMQLIVPSNLFYGVVSDDSIMTIPASWTTQACSSSHLSWVGVRRARSEFGNFSRIYDTSNLFDSRVSINTTVDELVLSNTGAYYTPAFDSTGDALWERFSGCSTGEAPVILVEGTIFAVDTCGDEVCDLGEATATFRCEDCGLFGVTVVLYAPKRTSVSSPTAALIRFMLFERLREFGINDEHISDFSVHQGTPGQFFIHFALFSQSTRVHIEQLVQDRALNLQVDGENYQAVLQVPDEAASSSHSSNHALTIVGISLGVLFALVLVVFAGAYKRKRQRIYSTLENLPNKAARFDDGSMADYSAQVKRAVFEDNVGLLTTYAESPPAVPSHSSPGSDSSDLEGVALYDLMIPADQEPAEPFEKSTIFACKDDLGNTPLMWAVESGNIKALRWMLGFKPPLDVRNFRGHTPLHLAVMRPEKSALAAMLIDAGADCDVADNQGVTPLHCACRCQPPALVEKMLAAGAKLDSADDTGQTPLMMACASAQSNIVRAIVAHVSEVAPVELRDLRGWTALHWAASVGDAACIDELLQIKSIDLCARNLRDETALHLAAREGNCDVIKALMADRFNRRENQLLSLLLLENFNGQTAYDLAESRGAADCAELLCEKREELEQAWKARQEAAAAEPAESEEAQAKAEQARERRRKRWHQRQSERKQEVQRLEEEINTLETQNSQLLSELEAMRRERDALRQNLHIAESSA